MHAEFAKRLVARGDELTTREANAVRRFLCWMVPRVGAKPEVTATAGTAGSKPPEEDSLPRSNPTRAHSPVLEAEIPPLPGLCILGKYPFVCRTGAERERAISRELYQYLQYRWEDC